MHSHNIKIIIFYTKNINRIVGDNVDFEIHARIQSKDHANQSIHWTHQYAVRDRAVNPKLESTNGPKPVKGIHLSELLPGELTCATLQKRWAVLISRIITTYLKQFKCFNKQVVWHIPHKYSTEMSSKSDIVSILKTMNTCSK